MKVYFLVIIVVLVIVILLLFYLLYKIYILHIKSYDDGYYDDEEETKQLNATDEVDSGYVLEAVESSQESISSKTGSSFVDETGTTAIQPNVKSVVGPILSNISPEKWRTDTGAKEKCAITVLFEYITNESRLRVTLIEASNLPKAKNGCSEAYVDMQLTPYKRRTYRPPGYRRPLRGCLKRPIDFTLEPDDVRTHYFVLFLLRYDPFSRLKVDGEAISYFGDLDGLMDDEQISVTLELHDSEQQFTGFIFRQGGESTRSLNGLTRSHNGSTRSPSGLRRSQDDSARVSARSFNGFSRSKNEGISAQSAEESQAQSASHGLTEDRLRASTKTSNGIGKSRDEQKLDSGRLAERGMRKSSRSFTMSSRSADLSQHAGFNRAEDGKIRESSRSFSGFVKTRDRAKLPPSGLTKAPDESTR